MSNVLNFKKPQDKEPTWSIPMTLSVCGDDLTGITVHLPDLTIGDKEQIAHHLFTAFWWMARDIRETGESDPMDLLFLCCFHRGGLVRTFAPTEGNKDNFGNEEAQGWLRRKLEVAFEMALPSWSAEQPASGTTSPSHSANIDQLSFSW